MRLRVQNGASVGSQMGFVTTFQGENNSVRRVKKARMDKLGTESGVYDDGWDSILKVECMMMVGTAY